MIGMNKDTGKDVRKTSRELNIVSADLIDGNLDVEATDHETAVQQLKDSLAESYTDRVDSIADMAETAETFAERQELADGQPRAAKQLENHHSESPVLSGGDVDAAWDQANDVGSETVGGTAPTPEQNDIDAMGEALGIQQGRTETLNISETRRMKDERRAELYPEEEGDDE